MSKNPNPNLWSVTYTHRDVYGAKLESQLWILAATAETATSKARRHLKTLKLRASVITTVEHEGDIDVF